MTRYFSGLQSVELSLHSFRPTLRNTDDGAALHYVVLVPERWQQRPVLHVSPVGFKVSGDIYARFTHYFWIEIVSFVVFNTESSHTPGLPTLKSMCLSSVFKITDIRSMCYLWIRILVLMHIIGSIRGFLHNERQVRHRRGWQLVLAELQRARLWHLLNPLPPIGF